MPRWQRRLVTCSDHPLLPHLVQVKEDTLAQLKENLPPVIFCTMAGNQMDTRNLTINLPKTTRTTTRAEKRTSSRTGKKYYYIQGWEYSTLLQCLERNIGDLRYSGMLILRECLFPRNITGQGKVQPQCWSKLDQH